MIVWMTCSVTQERMQLDYPTSLMISIVHFTRLLNILRNFASGEMRRNIFLSVKEALHNSSEDTPGRPAVDITITISKDLCILIHDNGKGINLENIRKYGNGLNNITKRMAEIGGFAGLKMRMERQWYCRYHWKN